MISSRNQKITNGKQYITRFVIGFLLSILVGSSGAQVLQPESVHSQVDKTVSRLLSRFHYSQLELNDSLSSAILDRYIKRLDPGKNYFMASDIEHFEKYRHEMDDFIFGGNLDPAFEIFNVFKRRVNARLDNLQSDLKEKYDFTVDEELVYDQDDEPWPTDLAALDKKWHKRLKSEALNLKLAGKEQADIEDILVKRYQNIQRRINQYDSEEVFELFMNAYTQSLDPHTNYFSPITSENFGIRMSLSFEGIGARLTTENEYVRVVEIIPGGPADLDKRLKANDYIIGVDEHNDGKILDVIGWKLDDVVQRIRGHKGSAVRLQIIPGGDIASGMTRYVTLTRDKVKLEEQAAKSDTVQIEHGSKQFSIGVIEIPTFYFDFEAQARNDKEVKSTTTDVKELIAKLKQQNRIDGLIIDLRGNGGGSLQEAIRLTGLFIDQGPVVQVRQSNGYIEIEKDTESGLFYDGPLMVMVDEYSASASEIFAAAIQDYGRGLIVGNQTFGKGTVQQLISLDRFIPGRLASRDGGGSPFGRIKVTMAKFYRVNGGSTQHRGVIPDISFPSRHSALDFGESSLVNALMWDQIKPARFQKYGDVETAVKKLQLRHKKRIAGNREFQYLAEDIREMAEEDAKNSISLNEQIRKEERKQRQEKRLKRENERRAALGLPPADPNDDDAEPLRLRDFIRDESAHILLDWILLESGDVAINAEKSQFKLENQ